MSGCRLAAKLVAVRHGLLRLAGDCADGRGEGTVSVEDRVTVILPDLAVDMVAAAVDRHVDDGAGGAAKLGAVVVGLGAELIDGIR